MKCRSRSPPYPNRDGTDSVHDDFRDLLDSLLSRDVRFIVVGAHALAVHGVPRATGDFDVWIEPSDENADRVWSALAEFGAPLEALDVRRSDLTRTDVVIQLGLPPRRIDLLTGVTGLSFEEGWDDRIEVRIAELEVPVLGRASLIRNKRATGRPKDLADLDALGEE